MQDFVITVKPNCKNCKKKHAKIRYYETDIIIHIKEHGELPGMDELFDSGGPLTCGIIIDNDSAIDGRITIYQCEDVYCLLEAHHRHYVKYVKALIEEQSRRIKLLIKAQEEMKNKQRSK